MEEIKPNDWNNKQIIVHYNDGTDEKVIQRGISELGIIIERIIDRALKPELFYIPNSSIWKTQLFVKQPYENTEEEEKQLFMKEE